MTNENDTLNKPSDSEKTGCPIGCSIDFSTFVLSMATTAMSHLGEVPDPVTGYKNTNLDEAKQIIDILCMLEKKTKGNLSTEETRMMEHFLYELRMKYLKMR